MCRVSTASEASTPLIQRMTELIQIGGPVVWLLTVLSVFSLTLVIIKLWQLAQIRPESDAGIAQALLCWRQGERTQALNTLQGDRPVTRMVRFAMQNLEQGVEAGYLAHELSRQANALVHQLRAYLRPLDVIAGLSPLLGLLGTVSGMILAFQQMEAAGRQVDPSILSGGIWQALLTTAAGLVVAIPVATVHSWFERKAERVSHRLNDAFTQLVAVPLSEHKAVSRQYRDAEAK